MLYKDRDLSEAQDFILKLFNELNPKPNEKVLDLACGKGRHAFFVSSLGYHTTGVDLSPDSIKDARKLASDNLAFFVHDMREPLPEQKYDVVLNLFTSFGYFENQFENEKMLNSISTYLSPDGQLVIDFMNSQKICTSLVPHEVKNIDGIAFNITKRLENGIIIKSIDFVDDGIPYHFEEKVQALGLEDFERLLKCTGFDIVKTFGDYDLNPYEESSDRLILLIKKKK
jgi:SAM-dependent methyltransferase